MAIWTVIAFIDTFIDVRWTLNVGYPSTALNPNCLIAAIIPLSKVHHMFFYNSTYLETQTLSFQFYYCWLTVVARINSWKHLLIRISAWVWSPTKVPRVFALLLCQWIVQCKCHFRLESGLYLILPRHVYIPQSSLKWVDKFKQNYALWSVIWPL